MKLFIARWIATCNWVGLSPIAPGTVASVLAAATFAMLRMHGALLMHLAVLTGVVLVAGLWASEKVSKALGDHDPSCVVIDEWVAVWLLCLIIPLTLYHYMLMLLLFRLFDISKFGPVSWAERMPGAWGIMLDDLVAAACAGAVLQFILFMH